jgi:hypothetical protein
MNIDWTIVGVVVGVLALIIAYLQLKRTPSNGQKNEGIPNKVQNFNKSEIKASTMNAIQGETVNLNQTIVNNIIEGVQEPEIEKKIESTHIPEFEKNRRKIASEKEKLRAYIYAVFTSARAQKLDSKLEIRHVQDVIEKVIGVDDNLTLEELKHMNDEKIIEFKLNDGEVFISPYTKIILTSKFYTNIL